MSTRITGNITGTSGTTFIASLKSFLDQVPCITTEIVSGYLRIKHKNHSSQSYGIMIGAVYYSSTWYFNFLIKSETSETNFAYGDGYYACNNADIEINYDDNTVSVYMFKASDINRQMTMLVSSNDESALYIGRGYSSYNIMQHFTVIYNDGTIDGISSTPNTAITQLRKDGSIVITPMFISKSYASKAYAGLYVANENLINAVGIGYKFIANGKTYQRITNTVVWEMG